MINFFSKVISIITSVVTTIFPFMGQPTPAPLVQHTPIVEQRTVESPTPSISSIVSRQKETVPVTVKPSQTPTPSQLQNFEEQIINSTPQPTPKPYIAPPTSAQLTNLRRVCLWSVDIQTLCDDPDFMPGYYSNLTFRTKIDELFTNFLAVKSGQQQQRIAIEKQTLDCIMAPTPENERAFDPATQNYLRQLRCGTVTAADRTNYELSRIKSSVDELKYRLDSKMSFLPKCALP